MANFFSFFAYIMCDRKLEFKLKIFKFPFTECTSDKENWMCLNCGQVLCGRYENGHALHHSELHTQHNVCLNTLNCMVYCYKCDDFVINGKHLLDNLRKEFNNDELYSSSESNPASASSSDSGCSDEAIINVTSPITSRGLRPRKRTNSNANGNVSPTKKKLRKVSHATEAISLLNLSFSL